MFSHNFYIYSGVELDQTSQYTEVEFTGPIAGVHYGYKDKTIQALKFWTCKDDPNTEFS